MTVFLNLRCDACGKGPEWVAGKHSTPATMRAFNARVYGWHKRPRVNTVGYHDICGTCWAEGKR